jgi:hypothetical protein
VREFSSRVFEGGAFNPSRHSSPLSISVTVKQ